MIGLRWQSRGGNGWRTLRVAVLALAFLMAGCNAAQETTSPAAQATVDALAAANAQLSTQVAELSVAAGTPAPVAATATAPQAAAPAAAPATVAPATVAPATVVPATVAPPVVAPAAVVPAAVVPTAVSSGDGTLPRGVIEVNLAPAGETLYDLRLDRATNHIFVTDSANQLHVLDATTYLPQAVLPYGGWLQLDSEHNRLYVYRPYISEGEESVIHVIDTATLREIGTVPGRALAVDPQHNRLFVGEPYSINTQDNAPGVRILDGATLQQTTVFTQSGEPVYNPLRNELLISAYTVYSADPENGKMTGDLFPELTDVGENGFLWCNGCLWVDDVQFHPDEQLVSIAINAHCTGKGCGRIADPRFFDAASMQEITPALAPQLQADCGSQSSAAGVVDGRRFVNAVYDRYVVYNNVLVTGEQGERITQRDGLRIDYINPRTGQGYLYDGTVVDLATLTPVGRWPAACLFADEAQSGLLFGRRSGSLYVIAERGGQPALPEQPLPAVPSTQWPIRQLAVSPNFAADSTLLAVNGEGIYRSTDGGQRWLRLHGGLPEGQGSNWIVAFSPTYASDKTIFAGGDRGEFWGEGVWRSQDGGDNWQAAWGGLEQRRIHQFFFAPEFASSRTLVVEAAFYDVESGQSGDSYQQSTDGGVQWTLVVTGNVSGAEGSSLLPPVSELLPGYVAPAALPVRLASLEDSLQVTIDGSTWITPALKLAEGDVFFALLPAPAYPSDRTIFAVAQRSLWRSIDNGATWSSWDDARAAALDDTNGMRAAAIAAVAGGGSRLFAGTADGQVWALDPAQMAWKAAPAPVAAAQGPSPLATPTPAPAAAAPAVAQAAVTATTAAAVTAAVTAGAAVTAATEPAQGTATQEAASPSVAAAVPSPTPAITAEPLAGEPPTGLFRPQGSLSLVWENNPRAQQELGWARQEQPANTGGALQRFENGVMVWREDTQQIFVFFNDGTWQSFSDTFQEGDRESDPSFAPPPGGQQPIRGFGKVWREHDALRDKLGWALAKEQSQPAEVHLFERGVMLRYGAQLFIVVGAETDRGTWY